MTRELEEARRALSAWALEAAEVCPLGTGLINRTFLVEEGGSRSVLQRVNPIFEPRIHENILAVTNALRHGHATHIRVRAKAVGQSLLLDVTDNGPGLAAEHHAGRGTDSMRNRAQQLAGTIDWTAGTRGGTKVVLEFPLPR